MDNIQKGALIALVAVGVLNHVEEKQERLVSTKERQELTDIIEFESILKERIEDLNVKLKNSNNLRI
jgi:hypothetical protein